ncbi:hypothetical protein DY000_02012465 [Brassica cretica]|uniref:Uncharacterized protein n=1 Tax=Brassica cretica TaxID=69181 RepID=A0ABQ7CMH0_BRACR|nr:hypothetical protein DY000_02012465 [Brassica cretica]
MVMSINDVVVVMIDVEVVVAIDVEVVVAIDAELVSPMSASYTLLIMRPSDQQLNQRLEARSPKWLLEVQIGSTKDVTGWSIWSEIDCKPETKAKPMRCGL